MTDAAADLAHCRDMLRGGSRTFYAASLVLPRKVADPAMALYAFCRAADDAIDLDGGRSAAITRLQDRLACAYAGRPFATPVDRAFADVVSRFAIPRALPDALIEGLVWDTEGRRYETFDELVNYAVRVAGTVGAMMSLVMGRRTPEIVARACDLGIAMQLTNIARDVGEDARAGRLYLPLSWMRDAGLDPDAWLASPRSVAPLRLVVARLLAAADDFYARASEGIAALPAACRPGIHAARLIYAEIGREVVRRDYDSVSQRAVVSGRRKIRLIADACAAGVRPAALSGLPVQPQARFLLDAIAATPQRDVSARGMSDRAVWVLDLFERLERRERMARTSVPS